MLKKIILGIVALLLLVGAENLLAMEKKDRPKAEQEQKGPVEQLRRQRAGEEAGRRDVEGMQQRRRQRAVSEAEPERVKALQQKPQQLRPGQVRPMQEGSGRLLDELTKAYRENDREKMGQLIRKMHQLRQKVRKAMGVPGEAGRDFRGRPRLDVPPSEEVVRPMPPVRGMGDWGRGFQGRGMGRRGQGFQGRGMGGWGRGFQGRGMGGPGRGFRGRGMGGRGRGFPAPWCPWLQDPVPEMD